MDELEKHMVNEHEDKIRRLFDHADVANKEMGIIKNDIGWIKNEFYIFVKTLNKLDGRIWWILGSVMFGALALTVQVLLAIYKK